MDATAPALWRLFCGTTGAYFDPEHTPFVNDSHSQVVILCHRRKHVPERCEPEGVT